MKGHRVTVIDRHDRPGGSLLGLKEEELPAHVLQKELALIKKAGVVFQSGVGVDEPGFKKIVSESDAVLVAVGQGESGIKAWGLPMHPKGVEADESTYRVEETNIFVVGSALKPSRMAIRALGQGKESAFSVDQYLQGKPLTGERFRFNSRFGKLDPAEYAAYMKESVAGPASNQRVWLPAWTGIR